MIAGVVICEEKSEFEIMSEEFWEKWCKEKISVEEDVFSNICKKFKDMFESKF